MRNNAVCYAGVMRTVARLSFLLAVLFGMAALPKLVAQSAQHDPSTLLLAARSSYYNLSVAGVQSFHCSVDVDWPKVFASLGAPLAEDGPTSKSLQSTHVSLTDELNGNVTVDVEHGEPSETVPDKRAQQIVAGLKQMVEGFLQAWSPTLNGRLLAATPKSFDSTDKGFLFDDSTPQAKDLITLDKQLRVIHLSSLSEQLGFEADTRFEPTDKGLVMVYLEADYRQPSAAPPVHLTMNATFAPVGKYLLPATLLVGIPNVLTMKMAFTGCTVQTVKPEEH